MSTPLKVLQLTSTSDMGGAENMALALALNMDRSKFHCSVASLVGGGELIRQAESHNLSAVHLGFESPVDPAGMRRLYRQLKTNQYDIIQTHGLRADSVARWISRMAGIKTVVSTIHSIDPWRSRGHSFVDRLTSPFVTHWVAVCQAALDASVARGEVRPADATVVPIGIPPRSDISLLDKSDAREKLGLPINASPLVGVIANLRSMKGHQYALEAAARLVDDLPDLHLVFAGRDDLGGSLQRQAQKLGIESRVTFLGFTRDIPHVLAALDIFLLPSDWEGFPLSILEAMQASVPVVASRTGGIPEMARHGQDGILVQPGSIAEISNALKNLHENWALRATMVKSASARVESEFSLELMVNRTEAIFLKSHEKP